MAWNWRRPVTECASFSCAQVTQRDATPTTPARWCRHLCRPDHCHCRPGYCGPWICERLSAAPRPLSERPADRVRPAYARRQGRPGDTRPAAIRWPSRSAAACRAGRCGPGSVRCIQPVRRPRCDGRTLRIAAAGVRTDRTGGTEPGRRRRRRDRTMAAGRHDRDATWAVRRQRFRADATPGSGDHGGTGDPTAGIPAGTRYAARQRPANAAAAVARRTELRSSPVGNACRTRASRRAGVSSVGTFKPLADVAQPSSITGATRKISSNDVTPLMTLRAPPILNGSRPSRMARRRNAAILQSGLITARIAGVIARLS